MNEDSSITAVEMVAIIKAIVQNVSDSPVGDKDIKSNLDHAIANLNAAEKWLKDCPIIIYN